MRTFFRVGAGLVAAVVFGAAAQHYLVPLYTGEPGKPSFSGTKEESAYWESRIKAAGGEKAYAELVSYNRGRSYDAMHQSAHLFGGALFRTQGDSALSVCDSRFSFGCFHEFLGEAIAAEGPSAIGKLNESCIEALPTTFLSCQHGIGHGILASLGYSRADLDKALAECSSLPRKDPIGGCYGGVFMEYNFQTMLLDQARLRRPEGGDYRYPCDDLPGEYGKACYFWQPQWLSALWGPGVESFSRIGDFCRTGQAAEERRACFEGAGEVAPESSHFDPAQTTKLCQAVARSDTDELYCRSMAANSFFVTNDETKPLALTLCSGYRGEQEAYCLSYARNTANVAVPKLLP